MHDPPDASRRSWDLDWVALDLETTGLDPDSDDIIEVGAVKYRGAERLEVFQRLVNPLRPLPEFVQTLTGISPTELAKAPAFSAVADELQQFLGDCPIVGHNIGFDAAFLHRMGLRSSGPLYDTLDMASVLMPTQIGYALGHLAEVLGIAPAVAHRAKADAETAAAVFLALLDRLRSLAPPVLGELRRIAERSDWPLADLFREFGGGPFAVDTGAAVDVEAEVGLEGLDTGALVDRLAAAGSLQRRPGTTPVRPEEVSRILGADGALAGTLEAFEYREVQARMGEGVARVLSEGGQLVVEAGTGTGKSLAYLVPAAMFAMRNGRRVVVSTNTINLQEQLIGKDLPGTVEALKAAGEDAASELRYGLLKGRGNYLCLRRWARLKNSESLSSIEARTAAKLLVWLQDTSTGDRGELNLTAQEAAMWSRLSAAGYDDDRGLCPLTRKGMCFYHAARRKAEGAQLLVVNHALLALDASIGGLLPEYAHVIVDEAHNLEEVATDQWGFTVDEDAVEAFLDRLAGGSATAGVGLLAPITALARSLTVPEVRRSELDALSQGALDHVEQAKERSSHLFRLLTDFATKHTEGDASYGAEVRLTRAARAQPAWSQVEIAWEDLNVLLSQVVNDLDRLSSAASRLSETDLPDREDYQMEVASLGQRGIELAEGLKAAVANPDQAYVYWIGVGARDGAARVSSAPLRVGPALNERLFAHKESLILTGATLSTENNLEYIKERLQLDEPREVLLGSPFDYPRLVMAYIPKDIPEPNHPGYMDALVGAVAGVARAAHGRTMVLFTGWTALRNARGMLAEMLADDGIAVLGQGYDGSPRQLVDRFRREENLVLLGTGSFWEGVDIAGEALSVLVIARLPFNVPTDPVFAARSQQFEDPFNEYAIPQAVLRFKQGFGRLIRRKTDRGVLVPLDRRISSRTYGSAFLDSIPNCTRKFGPVSELPAATARWLAQIPLPAAR